LNEEKRQRYDQFGHAGVDGQSGFGQVALAVTLVT
jgi:DnaJ-class molecular chaperone